MKSQSDIEWELFLGFCKQPDATPGVMLTTLIALAVSGNEFAKELTEELIRLRREDVGNEEHFREGARYG